MAITERFKQAWRAFTNKDPTEPRFDYGISYSTKPDRPRISGGAEKTILNSFYTRIAVDASKVRLQHVQLDENENYVETLDTNLNRCFSQMANIDQTGRAFLEDCVISLLDEGNIAIVPVTTDRSAIEYDNFAIYELRVGKIITWYPKDVKLRVYNEEEGQYREIIMPKASVALVENPFYPIMNEYNTNVRKLVNKLAITDTFDEQAASGKLDIILQLPYAVKSETQLKMAQERRSTIETQLVGSKYGIAYIDGTEHITQLNRPAENNVMARIDYYKQELYKQMGISEEVLNGTAKEEVMNEYYEHVVEPILTAITEAMAVKFLSQKALTLHQSIRFYRKPIKFISNNSMAELADKLGRNGIVAPNEFRQLIGLKPSDQASANVLGNRNNLPQEMGVDEESLDPLNTYNDLQSEMKNLQSIDRSLEELDRISHRLGDDDVLEHYASEYYNPEKAHEYYEAHKRLKGYANRYGGSRGSTKSQNDKGKEVAAIAKYHINQEKKSKIEALNESLANKREANKQERKRAMTELKNNVSNLVSQYRSELENMNEAQKKHAKIKMRAEIKKLRAEADELRQQMSEYYTQISKELSESAKTEREGYNDEAAQKYADEIQKILKDPSLVGGQKKSSSSKVSWKLAVERNRK